MAQQPVPLGTVKVKLTDMNEDILKEATNTISDSFKKYTNEKEIAGHIKREFHLFNFLKEFILFFLNSLDKKF